MNEHLETSAACRHSSHRKVRCVAIALCAALDLSVSIVASAQNVFLNLTSTASGYATYDSDIINIERAGYTGRGVYVAVIDGGLDANWRDYFPIARVATDLGIGFYQQVLFPSGPLPLCKTQAEKGDLHTTTWIGGNADSHGTFVTSTILGYFYHANADARAGYSLPPMVVRGLAPDVTVIPIKVIADYHVPAIPSCGIPAFDVSFGTDEMVAAGIDYATDLKLAGYSPMVINMSLTVGASLPIVVKDALDRAIESGVIIVAAAGNSGETGMIYPAAYAPIISVGAVGWIGEWFPPPVPAQLTLPPSSSYRMWWLQYPSSPLLPGSGEVRDPTKASDIYVADFSSRALTSMGQQLDVLAPGAWVRGPYESGPGYSHLPWWSQGTVNLVHRFDNLDNFFFTGGTSMSTPHATSVAALMLEKNSALTQGQVKSILKATALPLASSGSRQVFDPFEGLYTQSWDTQCDVSGIGVGPVLPCDAVGAGVIQADSAIVWTP